MYSLYFIPIQEQFMHTKVKKSEGCGIVPTACRSPRECDPFPSGWGRSTSIRGSTGTIVVAWMRPCCLRVYLRDGHSVFPFMVSVDSIPESYLLCFYGHSGAYLH